MSMVTRSEKRDRAYQRAYDHDEARRLREEDPKTWTYTRLAEHFNVSITAIHMRFNARTRERMASSSLEWIRENKRQLCKGDCGALVWMNDSRRSGYCHRCLMVEKYGDAVREDSLLCRSCGEWKPDDGFYRTPGKNHLRRNRKSMCRACDTKARADHRARHAEASRAYDRNYKRKDRKMAKFTVLQKDDAGIWRERGAVEAVSRLHAIEKVADAEGDYVAVSTSQMQPKQVRSAMAFKIVKGENED